MSERGPAAVGWQLEVDAEAGELRLEHEASGNEYVLDADGGLRVPGGSEVGEELGVLREALAGVLGEERTALPDGGQSSRCAVECDDATGEVHIESDTGIRLDAPVIEVKSDGNTSVNAGGVLTLEGSLVRLN
jgi:hypothetical protein